MMEKTIREVLAEPTGFVQWLRAKGPGEQVGYTYDEDSCPLQHYLSETLHNESIYVNNMFCGIHTLGLPEEEELPVWAKEFVPALDDLAEDWSSEEPVTAQQALDALRGVVGLREEE